jgi:hypothetical protein
MYAETGRERRRRDLAGRITRATFPVRQSIGALVAGFPCNVIGHHWVEIPRARWRSSTSGDRRMHFRCSRCQRTGEFTN